MNQCLNLVFPHTFKLYIIICFLSVFQECFIFDRGEHFWRCFILFIIYGFVWLISNHFTDYFGCSIWVIYYLEGFLWVQNLYVAKKPMDDNSSINHRHFINWPLQKNSNNLKIIYPLKNEIKFCLIKLRRHWTVQILVKESILFIADSFKMSFSWYLWKFWTKSENLQNVNKKLSEIYFWQNLSEFDKFLLLKPIRMFE